jgi:hypothetical protein
VIAATPLPSKTPLELPAKLADERSDLDVTLGELVDTPDRAT